MIKSGEWPPSLIDGMPIHSFPVVLSVLPDPGNMAATVGISLLSCMRVEIYVINYPLPVNGRHLWFTTYLDIGQSPFIGSRSALAMISPSPALPSSSATAWREK